MTLQLGSPDASLAPPSSNGAAAMAPVFPVPTPKEIETLVTSYERYASELRQRMEDDWQLVIQTEKGDVDGNDEGYRRYTSNEPRTYFETFVSKLAGAKLRFESPTARAQRGKRDRESAHERFIVGILKANDERLARLGQFPLKVTLAAFIAARGSYFGRCTLVKDPITGETYPDITPWDPMHVSHGMGAKGLKWACYKSKKTKAEVQAEYPGLEPSQNGYFAAMNPDDSTDLDVYEWWDEQNNMVAIDGKVAKPPTPYGPPGQPRTPVFFGSVGPLPLVQSLSGQGKSNLKHYGESIFAPNRGIYDKLNLVLSIMLQMVALSRNRAFILYSASGQKTVENNPWVEGSQVPLVTDQDKLELVPLLEIAKEAAALLGIVSAELQRGAFPYPTYGQLSFQLSGYAVRLLGQAEDAPLGPRVQAEEQAYSQIANLIRDQFATGAFGSMQLRGWDNQDDWFDETFEPEMLQGLPALEVSLVVDTPQDEAQNMELYLKATSGVWPAMDRRSAREKYLHVEDPDSMDDAIKEQVAETMLPIAAIVTLMIAAEKQGRPLLAALYYGEAVKQGIILPPRPWMNPTDGGGGGGNGASAGGGGMSPETLSAPEQGAPTPQPTPQAGPNVPPGSPRPGAQGQPA